MLALVLMDHYLRHRAPERRRALATPVDLHAAANLVKFRVTVDTGIDEQGVGSQCSERPGSLARP